jgi:hypothetical protein
MKYKLDASVTTINYKYFNTYMLYMNFHPIIYDISENYLSLSVK